MKTFEMFIDVDTRICNFGESEADAIARQLEFVAENSKESGGSFSAQDVCGAYRVK